MIKKLLATTLATLAVASTSLPVMAVETPAQPTQSECDPINFIEELENIEKDNKDIQLYEEKDAGNGFTAIELSADQKQALKDMDKSEGYIAIRNNVKSLKQHASNSYYAASKFNAARAGSEAWNTIKDVGYIAGDVVCYPISGGVRYAYNNGLLTKAKDKVVDYVKTSLKNKALGYVGLKKDSKNDKKDGKLAKVFKWGKSAYNFFAK